VSKETPPSCNNCEIGFLDLAQTAACSPQVFAAEIRLSRASRYLLSNRLGFKPNDLQNSRADHKATKSLGLRSECMLSSPTSVRSHSQASGASSKSSRAPMTKTSALFSTIYVRDPRIQGNIRPRHSLAFHLMICCSKKHSTR
jgi:hypothetical protein